MNPLINGEKDNYLLVQLLRQEAILGMVSVLSMLNFSVLVPCLSYSCLLGQTLDQENFPSLINAFFLKIYLSDFVLYVVVDIGFVSVFMCMAKIVSAVTRKNDQYNLTLEIRRFQVFQVSLQKSVLV